MAEHIYSLNLTLEKILAEEHLVLLDSSFFSKRRSLPENTYMIKSYRQLDEHGLQNELIKLEKNHDVLTREKIWVLPETVEELRKYQEIISTKASFLNAYKNRSLDHPKAADEYKGEGLARKKQLFDELCFISSKMVRAVKNKVYVPKNSERYEAIFSIVKTITEAERLKGPKSIAKWYKIKPYRKEPQEFYTDEKIIAALLDSTFNNPIAAIGKDYHLRLIFKEVCELLSCRELRPYNNEIAWLMRKNPASLYYYRQKENDNDSSNHAFFKENMDPGWHLFRTRHFRPRDDFRIIYPYEEAKKGNFNGKYEKIPDETSVTIDREIKYKVISQLIRMEKANSGEGDNIIIRIMPENAKGNELKY